MKNKTQSTAAILRKLFCVCPDTGLVLRLTNIRGAEAGLDHTELTMESKSGAAKWKFKIYQEEI